MTIRTGIFGGSGYAGGELLRYLAVHPDISLDFVTSRRYAGQAVGDKLPNLAPFLGGLTFQHPDDSSVKDLDALFLGLPHNTSQTILPGLLKQNSAMKVLDLAGDFRTPDPAGYARYYGVEHQAPELAEQFVYGFTEGARDAIRKARFVANPGCFATALLLGLWPLKQTGRLSLTVTASAVTGSSGAGIDPKPTTHHPHRATNMRAYKALTHQHLLEVRHWLGQDDLDLLFVPHSGPFVRGIFVTFIFPGLDADTLGQWYKTAYDGEFFIHAAPGSPELRLVQDTPFSAVGWAGTKQAACGFAAIDNLAKGTATQAIQNFNLMFGLDEKTGLCQPGGFV